MLELVIIILFVAACSIALVVIAFKEGYVLGQEDQKIFELKARHEFLLDLQEKVSSGTTPFFVVWTTKDDLYD